MARHSWHRHSIIICTYIRYIPTNCDDDDDELASIASAGFHCYDAA